MDQVNTEEECLPMPEVFAIHCDCCFSTLLPLQLPWQQGLTVAGHQHSLQHWTQASTSIIHQDGGSLHHVTDSITWQHTQATTVTLVKDSKLVYCVLQTR